MKIVTGWSGRFRSVALLGCLLVLFCAGGPLIAEQSDSGDQDEFTLLERQSIERVLKHRISDLLADKNEAGLSYKRGTFSKDFQRTEDGLVQATFTQDTAEQDHVKTQRLLLTLKGAGDKWEIMNEEVQDEFVGLYRTVLGDEKFFAFDSLKLDFEGLRAKATKGGFFLDYFRGEPVGLLLVADDLRFDYEPPIESASQYTSFQYHAVYGYYKDMSASELEFRPDHLTMVGEPVMMQQMLDSMFSGLREIDRQAAPAKLRQFYDSLSHRRLKGLRDNPFAGFGLDWHPERRQLWISLTKKGEDPLFVAFHGDPPKSIESTDQAVWLRYDSWFPKEVGFHSTWIDDNPTYYAPIIQYHSKETRESGVDPYDLEYRPDVDARDYEVETINGEVDLALEDAEELVGDVTVQLKAKRDLGYARFFIARERPIDEERKELKNPTLFVNSIQDGEGRELTWVKEGPFSGIAVFREPIAAGDSFTLRMQFVSRGSIEKLNPSFSYVSRGGWLPFVRFADIINDFDLTVRVPAKYEVLGVGTKAEDRIADGVRTTRWTTDVPVMFPSITFGEYISDEPRFKAKKSDGTEIPIRVHVDKVSTNTLRLDTTSFDEFQKEIDKLESGARGIRPKQLQAIGEQAANSINLYNAVFGVDYPYSRLDLVADPLGYLYGQAPSSLIYLGAFVFRGEGEVAGVPGFSNNTMTAKFLKSVVAHEVGHQWWGSTVVNTSSGNYWFVESLAEYASALFLENVFGPKEYQEQVEEWRYNILNRDMTVNVQDAIGLATPDFNYQAAVYNKGPYAFHILRMTYGDEKLYKFLKMLAQELQGKEIATRDIQRVAEKAYGVPMEWFFDQWIRGVGIPEFDFEYSTRRTEDGSWLVQGVIRQKVVIGRDKTPIDGEYYLGAVPITVTARKSKEVYRVPVRVEGAESKFAFKVKEEPLEVAFNKYNEILAHDINAKAR